MNEFNPKFNQSIYSASIKEDDLIGTYVVTVSRVELNLFHLYWIQGSVISKLFLYLEMQRRNQTGFLIIVLAG